MIELVFVALSKRVAKQGYTHVDLCLKGSICAVRLRHGSDSGLTSVDFDALMVVNYYGKNVREKNGEHAAVSER